MKPELLLAKRLINFTKSGLNSKNKLVKYILDMGVHNAYSIFGGNVRSLEYKYEMQNKYINFSWHQQCRNEEDYIRITEQIRELCGMRDDLSNEFLSREECNILINHLCTE